MKNVRSVAMNKEAVAVRVVIGIASDMVAAIDDQHFHAVLLGQLPCRGCAREATAHDQPIKLHERHPFELEAILRIIGHAKSVCTDAMTVSLKTRLSDIPFAPQAGVRYKAVKRLKTAPMNMLIATCLSFLFVINTYTPESWLREIGISIQHRIRIACAACSLPSSNCANSAAAMYRQIAPTIPVVARTAPNRSSVILSRMGVLPSWTICGSIT